MPSVEKAKRAFADWKVADEAARTVEHALRDAWEKFGRKEGPEPSEELIADVKRARARSNEKLQALVREMEAAKDRP